MNLRILLVEDEPGLSLTISDLLRVEGYEVETAPDGPLANLTERVPVEERYSLLFEGRSQAFDHILVSPALLPRVAGHGYAHHNADFPNDGNAGDGGSPVRAADHDVPWVAIRIP